MSTRDDVCGECNERLDACLCARGREDAVSEALGRGARTPSPSREHWVLVAGHRAFIRREGDGWVVEFEDPRLGTSRSTGLASDALAHAREHVRQRRARPGAAE